MPSNELAKQLEAINGRGLEGDEAYDLEMWQKGRSLAHVVNSPGWDVVLEILSSYAEKEAAHCINTDPGDKEAVLAAHAVAFAAGRIYALFVEDCNNLIAASNRVPDVVREGLRNSSPVPPESL
jgi:hypothetical protein